MPSNSRIPPSIRQANQLNQINHPAPARKTASKAPAFKPASAKPLLLRTPKQTGKRKKGAAVKPQDLYWKMRLKPELEKNGLTIRTRKAGFLELYRINPSIITKLKVEVVAKMVVDRTPILRESGRTRPNWDPVWDNIHPNFGEHRRHIVMSSPMRSATYKMCDLAKQMPPDACKAFFDRIQAIIIDHASQTDPNFVPPDATDPVDLAELESKLVNIMHNHKTNIFLGPGSWNSAIGGLAHLVQQNEYSDLERIKTAESAEELYQGLTTWLDKLSKAPVFGQTKERGEIVKVYSDMIKQVFQDFKLMHELIAKRDKGKDYDKTKLAIASDGLGFGTLMELKNHLAGIVLGFCDTVTTDTSEAKSGKLRMIQNGYFEFNKRFLIMSTTSLDQVTLESFQRDGGAFLETCKEFIQRETRDLAKIGVTDPRLLYGLDPGALKTLGEAAKFHGKGQDLKT